MENSSSDKTPMPATIQLNADFSGKLVDQKSYRAIIGSLFYLTATRPDIMYSTYLCARFQSDPKKSNPIVAKRILRYLKGRPNLGLWYSKDSAFELFSLIDSNHVGCKLNRKSTSSACQFLGDKLVSWSLKKQKCLSLSTAQAEYVITGSCFSRSCV